MSKGEYTRKEAGRMAYFDVTGRQIPSRKTNVQIKEMVWALSEEQQQRCRQYYRKYMEKGRPEYAIKYNKKFI